MCVYVFVYLSQCICTPLKLSTQNLRGVFQGAPMVSLGGSDHPPDTPLGYLGSQKRCSGAPRRTAIADWGSAGSREPQYTADSDNMYSVTDLDPGGILSVGIGLIDSKLFLGGGKSQGDSAAPVG